MSTIPTLPDETTAVIIGGGVVGTSIAYFLARETDKDITLLEKNAIGAGSTGDSSAIVRHHYGEQEIYTRMAWWSHQFYRRFEQETGEPIAHEESPRVTFAEEGSDDAAYANAGYEILSDLDIPVSRYESESFDDQYPPLALDEFDFAVSDETAAYSDGTDVASGFARAASNQGATIVTGTAVEGFEGEDSEITAIRTDDGAVSCEEVVIAAGPWSPRLANQVGIDLPITTEREQVIILEPAEENVDVPTAGLPGGGYIRSEGDGVLVATHHSGEECDPDRYDSQPDEETLLDLHESISDFVPELSDAGIMGEYCGVYSNTPDHDFILDQCGPDGCYVASGFSGHGFKQAPAVGRLMTDLITEQDSNPIDVDIEYFSLSRFENNEAGHGGGIQY
jgi:sarcosine oxidase subunit beta